MIVEMAEQADPPPGDVEQNRGVGGPMAATGPPSAASQIPVRQQTAPDPTTDSHWHGHRALPSCGGGGGVPLVPPGPHGTAADGGGKARTLGTTDGPLNAHPLRLQQRIGPCNTVTPGGHVRPHQWTPRPPAPNPSKPQALAEWPYQPVAPQTLQTKRVTGLGGRVSSGHGPFHCLRQGPSKRAGVRRLGDGGGYMGLRGPPWGSESTPR